MPEPKCRKRDACGKQGKLSCCKCLFYKIKANLANIQPENLQNVQKMRFWQKALGVNIWVTFAKNYAGHLALFLELWSLS